MDGHDVIDRCEVVFLFGSEVRREVHDEEIDVCVGEGQRSQAEQGFKLFSVGLPGVLVPVIDRHRKYHYFHVWAG